MHFSVRVIIGALAFLACHHAANILTLTRPPTAIESAYVVLFVFALALFLVEKVVKWELNRKGNLK